MAFVGALGKVGDRSGDKFLGCVGFKFRYSEDSSSSSELYTGDGTKVEEGPGNTGVLSTSAKGLEFCPSFG